MLCYKIEQSKTAAKYEKEWGDDRSLEPSSDSQGKLRQHDQEPEEAENRGQVIGSFDRKSHALQIPAEEHEHEMILDILPRKEGILGREILEPGERSYQREIRGIIAENSKAHVEMIPIGMQHITESQRHKNKEGNVKYRLPLK